MKRKPTTHQVQPVAVELWLAGRVKPPALGLTLITRRKVRNALAWWKRNVGAMR